MTPDEFEEARAEMEVLDRIVDDAVVRVLKSRALKRMLVGIYDKDAWARGMLLDHLLVNEVEDEETFYKTNDLIKEDWTRRHDQVTKP